MEGAEVVKVDDLWSTIQSRGSRECRQGGVGSEDGDESCCQVAPQIQRQEADLKVKLRCVRHVQRREGGYIGQRVMRMELEEKKKTSEEVHGCREGGHAEG